MNIIRHIPNTITSMNLFCGLMGVIFTFKGQLDTAFLLMIAAAVCDFCDGFSARLLKAYSELGKQLDSLADMVSFGTLPALMSHRMMVEAGTTSWVCYIPLLIGVFSALRLAKFNIDERQTENFIGLPTPACAMIIGSFAYYVCNTPDSILAGWSGTTWFIPAVSILLSALLVCEMPMFSMKFKKGSENKVRILRLTFACMTAAEALAVAILGLNWSMVILLVFIGYILINLIAYLFTARE